MNKGPLTIADIQVAVAARWGVPVSYLTQERRDATAVIPRHVAMYLCRELLGLSMQRIATAFARADHSTVFYAMTRVSGYCAADGPIGAAIDKLRKSLSERIADGG